MNLMTQCHILPDSKNNPSLCVLFDPCFTREWMGRGWLGLGDHLQLSRKTRVEILRLASTLKYTDGKFQHFHCLFESEAINPFNTHQTMFCTIISQYNICSTISVVQYPQLNICGTISAVECLGYNICCTTFAVQYLQYNYLTVYPLYGWLSINAWGVKTCIFSFTPVYAKSCICYVSVKIAGPVWVRRWDTDNRTEIIFIHIGSDFLWNYY